MICHPGSLWGDVDYAAGAHLTRGALGHVLMWLVAEIYSCTRLRAGPSLVRPHLVLPHFVAAHRCGSGRGDWVDRFPAITDRELFSCSYKRTGHSWLRVVRASFCACVRVCVCVCVCVCVRRGKRVCGRGRRCCFGLMGFPVPGRLCSHWSRLRENTQGRSSVSS